MKLLLLFETLAHGTRAESSSQGWCELAILCLGDQDHREPSISLRVEKDASDDADSSYA